MKAMEWNLVRMTQRRLIRLIGAILTLVAGLLCQPAYAARQISQFDITWTFDKELTTDGAGDTYQYGQFANGDYWVVGPVTVESVSPGWDGQKHGSMVNPVLNGYFTKHGYDSRSRAGDCFDDSVRAKFPLPLDPSDGIKSLISAKSLDSPIAGGGYEVLETAAILTIVDKPVAPGTFRPPYVSGSKPLYKVSQIRWDLLPTLEVPVGVVLPVDIGLGDFNDSRLMKRPWLDHGGFRANAATIHPIKNMNFYGAANTILPTEISDMALLVMLDIPEREELLIRFLQLGIDLYPISLKNGDTWTSGGGFGNGRKWPILFAGIMLDDANMKSPLETIVLEYPNTNLVTGGVVDKFGEDGHTYYGQPTADYPLNKPLWGKDCVTWGYDPPDFFGHHDCRDPDGILEPENMPPNGGGYRSCCTSFGWPGQALAAHLMGAESLWNHDAFFDYADRWVYEGNPDPGATSDHWTYGSSFIKYMWNKYRGPAYPDGKCDAGETPSNHPLDCGAPAEKTNSITQHGITWTFDKEYEYGQFANGDYWVVGPVTITSITPTPAGGRHGFEINPMPGQQQPYDSRDNYDGAPAMYYNGALQPSLPVAVNPDSSVVSTISNPETPDCYFTAAGKTYAGWNVHPDIDMPYNGEDDCSPSVLKTVAVLTVLGSPPPAGSLRPPYVGNNKPLYSSLNLRTDLLPSLAPVAGTPSLSKVERKFERVWLDHIFTWPARSLHPVENMHGYGAGISVDAGEGALRLLLNESIADKETLLIRYVQLGIDLYWMTQYGHYWQANGGHASGRKLPILFAGLMLDDASIKGIGSYEFPVSNGFGEDCQTYYDALGFPRWGIRHCWRPWLDDENDGYRSCCTSQSWVGQTLAARLLGLEGLWNHQAYFDYMDRWMTEDGDGSWGSAWADLMWETYRTIEDRTPPSLVSVTASENAVEILFNETLDQLSAENINNYTITNNISITSASLDPKRDRVRLYTSSHTEGVTYTVTVTNVQDLSGNPMPETAMFYQYYDDGLVSHWKFDEATGTSAADSSGNGNTGTLVNGPEWTTGRINGGVRFDGSDDAVEVPTGNFNANTGAIALWAYAESFSSDHQYLFGHAIQPWNNVIQLYTNDTNGNLLLGLGDSHTRRTNIQDLDAQWWYHIALSWDGTLYIVYVDGVAKASGAYTGLGALESFADIGNNGNRSERNGESFNGIIDAVRVYNRALTAAEVLNLFEADGLVISPIGDKQIDENKTLTFVVETNEPNIVVDINDHNLPIDPNAVIFEGNIFTWRPWYDQAGSYEVEFVAPHGDSVDFEVITITVNDVILREWYKRWLEYLGLL